MAIGICTSIITLNVNCLSAPTKRHRLVERIQKQDPYICCLQETHFRPKDTYRLKVRGWKNIFHANGKQKKAGVAILISDKTDLKIKKITGDKEGHYIMIKGSIQGEDITIINIYAPSIDIYNCYVFFLDWSLDHYVVSFLISWNILYFKVHFVWYEDCYPSFLLLSICMEYIFPSSHFQSMCVLKWVSCRQHIYGSCFCIHSASLCL